MNKKLGVGTIGASAERGWASVSHVPAVERLAGLELVAVASGSQEKGNAAAKAFGAKAGYANGKDVIADPNVDIVAIAVKVPDHRELVLAALAAGKHVYCEWPLGRDLAESEELAAAAQTAGVHVAIGLQARANPAVKQARSLIASGVVGRVLSARVVSTTVAFGKSVEEAMAFAEKPENGVTLLTIQGAHTLDLTIAVLGEYAALNAMTSIQFPEVEIGDDATSQSRSIPDHILVEARLSNGGALSVEVAGGRRPEEVTFRLEVTGETGVLVLEGGAPRGFQSGRLALSLNGENQELNEGELAPKPVTAENVAGIYAALRDDIVSGNFTAPDCQHAVHLTRMLDDVMSSSATGTRKQATDWPKQ